MIIQQYYYNNDNRKDNDNNNNNIFIYCSVITPTIRGIFRQESLDTKFDELEDADWFLKKY